MMAAESNSKRLRTEEEEENNGIDRISHLPNSILYHILSFLPTNTCVRTISLVSRRWRYIWKNLQVFDFDDKFNVDIYHSPNDENTEQFMLFTVFVNTVFSLRNSNVVRKFRLSCEHIQDDPFYTHSIDTWMHAAVGPQLEEFHLTLFTAGFNNLPAALFSCSNLVSLSLNGNILLQLQDSSKLRLRSLKVLQLLDMGDLDLNSVSVLLSGCPILEHLEVSFYPESLAKLRVSSSSLKWLKITVENNVGAYLEIDAPELKYLSLFEITFADAIAVRNLHKVEEAYLLLFSTSKREFVKPLLNLLRALSGIKHLELYSSTTKWLFAAPILDFPEFRHLVYLKLWLLSFNSSFLIDMLHKCPVLQTLITFNDKIDPLYDSSPSYGWETKPKYVPKCLVSQLTCIEFQGCQRSLNELEFTGYVLQNGLVLKTMLIKDCWHYLPNEWSNKISDLPRGSAMCQVKHY